MCTPRNLLKLRETYIDKDYLDTPSLSVAIEEVPPVADPARELGRRSETDVRLSARRPEFAEMGHHSGAGCWLAWRLICGILLLAAALGTTSEPSTEPSRAASGRKDELAALVHELLWQVQSLQTGAHEPSHQSTSRSRIKCCCQCTESKLLRSELFTQREEIDSLRHQLYSVQSASKTAAADSNGLHTCMAKQSFPSLEEGSLFAYRGCSRDVGRNTNVSSQRCQVGRELSSCVKAHGSALTLLAIIVQEGQMQIYDAQSLPSTGLFSTKICSYNVVRIPADLSHSMHAQAEF